MGVSDPAEARLEALKLLKDWAAWMITVETALLAFTGSALLWKEGVDFNQTALLWTLGSFAASILSAAWLLGGLPSLAQRITGGTEPVHRRPIFALPFAPRLGVLAFAQHAAFAIGIVSLVVLVVTANPASTGSAGLNRGGQDTTVASPKQ